MMDLTDRAEGIRAAEAGEGRVAEVPLLLPAREAAALEEVAWRQGLTAGQVMRRLIRDFLRGTPREARS